MLLALRAGGIGYQRWLVYCTPHFLFFLPEEKEKTGRARSKREKEVSPLRGDEGRGTRKGCFLRVRKSSARGVALAGVLAVIEWTSSSFRCR